MAKDAKDMSPEELTVDRYSDDKERAKRADAEVERRRVEKLRQQDAQKGQAAKDLLNNGK